jgi:hypothetical protein
VAGQTRHIVGEELREMGAEADYFRMVLGVYSVLETFEQKTSF